MLINQYGEVLESTQKKVAARKEAAPVVKPQKAAKEKLPIIKPRKVNSLAPVKKSIGKIAMQLWATIIGGIAPCISFDVAHNQTKSNSFLWVIVTGLLAYSAPTIQKYLDRYVCNVWKSWGFVIGMEAAMTFTEGWTSYAALFMVVSINALVLGQTMGRNTKKLKAIE
jgi:hypothetical protein